MTKIKLCGLTHPEDAVIVNEENPDYVGFVFWNHSRRNVTPERAQTIRQIVNGNIPAVGVFVDESPERILDLLERKIIQIVQLHGHETDKYIRSLKKQTSAPVIRAFQVRSAEDICRAEKSQADMILLDNGTGTGETFDWNMMETIRRPFFLAGGLHDGNVTEAIRKYQPYAVDVSSGIETDGKKDPAKIRRFVRAVRGMEDEEERI